jgi:hypothetical protein
MKFSYLSIFIGIGQAMAALVFASIIDLILPIGGSDQGIVKYVILASVACFLIFVYPIHLFGGNRKRDAVVVFSSTLLSMMFMLVIFSMWMR